jgi:hypothetical protein
MLFGQKYGLGEFAVGKPDQIPASAVHGIESPVNLGETDIPLCREFGTLAFRQIRHLLERIGPALINGFENLGGTVSWRERAPKIGTLAIKNGFQFEALWGVSWALMSLST